MRVLITGAGGQLATDLCRALASEEIAGLTHGELDVTSRHQVQEAIRVIRPDVVINTAAFHRVDDCEETEVEKAFAVNVLGVHNLALACRESGAALLHMSTDYVFDGAQQRPYTEGDVPRPINLYGVSKLAGELALRATLERHFIVRSSGLYGAAGASGKGGNFVNTMLRLAKEGREIRVVNDQVFSPTYTRHLAQKIAWLVHTESYGVWHITNLGECSWYEFAGRIFELAQAHPAFVPTTTAEFGARATRPAYSVLAHTALQKHQADDLPAWPEALRAYLEETGVL